MKKYLFSSTLLAATALVVPVWAGGLNVEAGGKTEIMYALNMSSDPSYIYGTLIITSTGTLGANGEITLGETIQNAGTINVADTTSFVIDGLTLGTKDGYDYYMLVDGSYSTTSTVTVSESFSNFTLSTGDSLSDWGVYSDNGYLVIYSASATTEGQSGTDLTWAGVGENNIWNTDITNAIWNDTRTGASGYYFTSTNNVTFGPNTDNLLSTEIVLGENITAGTVNITGSGYTLTASDTTNGNTLTATSIVLDDEESGNSHTFTIGEGVTVKAESLSETAGQLDLVVNGTLEISGTITVNTDAVTSESISGAGTLKANSLYFNSSIGSTLTISVTEAEFENVTVANHGGDAKTAYKTLVIGDGTNETTVKVNDTLLLDGGMSAVEVKADSILEVGTLRDKSGSNTSVSGEGKLIANNITIAANSGNDVQISVAEVQAGTVTISAPNDAGSAGYAAVTISSAKFTATSFEHSSYGSLTISSANFTADSASFTGGGTGSSAVSITFAEGASATIGVLESRNTHTITVENGATLTAGEIYRSGSTLNLAINGELNVTQLEGYTDSTGMISFGKESDSSSATGMAQSISGSGTVNAYGIESYLNSGGTLNISVANLNLGEGGISKVAGSTGTITIDGTKVGLYNTNTSEISANITIGSNGVTFNPESKGQTITLSGAVTGNGLVTKTGEGELAFTGTGSSLTSGLTVSAGTVSVATDASLTLGGTVTLASSIQNSGTITIDSNTSFVLDNLTMGTGGGDGQRDYYVLIKGSENGSSVSFSGTISNFTGGSIDSTTWNVWSEGLENGYLVIYGEATAAPTADNLYWAGTEGNTTWTNSGSTVDWSNANDGNAGYYFQNGENVTFGSAAESKSVTITETITAGAVTVDSAAYTWAFSGDGASVTADTLTLTGTNASLTISGNGTFILGNTSNQSLAGEGSITIGNGTTLKLLENADDKYEDTSITITVGSGGTLDVDGDGGTMFKLVLDGGTLTSSINMAETKKQLPNITLTADSTVDASHNIGMLGSSYSATSLTLNGHTLTKTGDGNFFLYNTAVTAGTIDVQAGTLELYGTDASVATVVIANGATLYIGNNNGNYSKIGVLNSSGTVDLKAGSTLEITGNSVISGTLSLETTNNVSSTLKVTNGANLTLNVTSTVVGSGSTLGVESSSSITLESTLAFKDSNSNVSGCVTFSDSAKLVISGDLLASLEIDDYATEGKAVAIIVANDISFGGTSVSEAGAGLDDLINAYVTAGNYLLTWTWNEGTLSASIVRAIPEPSIFGIIFGLSAIGLVATRRRRRKAA